MDEAATIEQARSLWAGGDRRAGLDLLLKHARTHRTDAAARHALVDFYREMRAPDQAGRWGIALGIATDLEQDRLARLLAGSVVADRDVAEFLALPNEPTPNVVLELVGGPVSRYRTRMRDRLPPADERAARESRASNAAIGAWVASVGVLLVGLIALWIVAGLELMDTRLFARALAALVALSVAVAVVLSGIVLIYEGKRSSIAWIVSGAVLLIATVVISALTRLTFVL